MSDTSDFQFTGGCYCGKVAYSSTVLPKSFTYCYCRTCSHLSGAPFLAFATVPFSAFSWTSGKDSLASRSYSSISTRTHCTNCGSPISMQYSNEHGPVDFGVTVGSINLESFKGPIPKVGAHIFVSSAEKAGWYQIPEDGVPRYPGMPDGFMEQIEAGQKSSA